MRSIGRILAALLVVSVTGGCASTKGVLHGTYRDPNMDFGQLQTVAVMPFVNLSRDPTAADRVRDVFMTMLLATQGVYVVPNGEVTRGVSRAGVAVPNAPTTEEVLKFVGAVKADAVITGTVREYGEVRSGSTSANVVSVGLELIEGQTGKVVWSATSTKGGVTTIDRLFGGGGEPMNIVTEQAVNDLIDKLFSK